MAEIQTLSPQTLRPAVAGLDRGEATAPGAQPWQRVEPTALGTGSIVVLLLVWQFLPDFVPMKAGTKLFFTVPSQMPARCGKCSPPARCGRRSG